MYIQWPSTGGAVPTYATAADLPASAPNGQLAVVLDTDTLYVFDGDTNTWKAIAGSGVAGANRTLSNLLPTAINVELDFATAVDAIIAAAAGVGTDGPAAGAVAGTGDTGFDGGTAVLAGGAATDGGAGAVIQANGGKAAGNGGDISAMSGDAGTGTGGNGGDIRLLAGQGDGAGTRGILTLSALEVQSSGMKYRNASDPTSPQDLATKNYVDSGASPEFDAGNSGTTKTIDWTNGASQKLTLTGNVTLTLSNPVGAQVYVLKLVQDGTGSRTVTWPAAVKWPSAMAPMLTTTAGAIDIISLYFDGTNYYGNSALAFG